MTTGSGNLHLEKDSKEFYNTRYSGDYMANWPDETKHRIRDVIRELKLPESGECLDFGCGNGILTDVIKSVLPKWNVYGCDLSEQAIQNATQRIENCVFFLNDDPRYTNKKFDFVFSHHVLEHVYDIKDVVQQIDSRTADNSGMLHILPCGNAGSFEYKLCLLRADGINPEMENRFFFEDDGHLRRLTTAQFENLFKPFGFGLKLAFYSNQYYGSINWMTVRKRFVLIDLFNPNKGKDLLSKIKLSLLFIKILIIGTFRRHVINYGKISNIKNIRFIHKLYLTLMYLPTQIAKYVDSYYRKLGAMEWEHRKHDEKGSEMYLYFTKKAESNVKV